MGVAENNFGAHGDEGIDEEQAMEDALFAGADDIDFDGDVLTVITDPNGIGPVRDALEEEGYTFLTAEPQYVPTTTTALTDEEAIEKMEKLLDLLEDNEDVQNVWHNWEMEEE